MHNWTFWIFLRILRKSLENVLYEQRNNDNFIGRSISQKGDIHEKKPIGDVQCVQRRLQSSWSEPFDTKANFLCCVVFEQHKSVEMAHSETKTSRIEYPALLLLIQYPCYSILNERQLHRRDWIFQQCSVTTSVYAPIACDIFELYP